MIGLYLWTLFIVIFIPFISGMIIKYITRNKYFRSVYDGSIWKLVDVLKKKNDKYYIIQNMTTFDYKTVIKKDLYSEFE